jgi:hypothetical protein
VAGSGHQPDPDLADVAEKALIQIRHSAFFSPMRINGPGGKITRIFHRNLDKQSSCLREGPAVGLKVSADMPADIHRLMALFPQPMRRQTAVEYLPWPRRREKFPGPTDRGAH